MFFDLDEPTQREVKYFWQRIRAWWPRKKQGVVADPFIIATARL
jgi:hypothetical protein